MRTEVRANGNLAVYDTLTEAMKYAYEEFGGCEVEITTDFGKEVFNFTPSKPQYLIDYESANPKYKIGSFYLTLDGRTMQYLGVLTSSKFLLFKGVDDEITYTYKPSGDAMVTNSYSTIHAKDLNISPVEVFVAKVKIKDSKEDYIITRAFSSKNELDSYKIGIQDLCFEKNTSYEFLV